jgi:group I intron endonuclease
MSNAKKGKYIGVNNPFFGKTHSPETIAKILSKNPTMKSIYVYDPDNLTLIYQFRSVREAIKNLKTSQVVFYRSLDTKVKFRGKWIITSSPF